MGPEGATVPPPTRRHPSVRATRRAIPGRHRPLGRRSARSRQLPARPSHGAGSRRGGRRVRRSPTTPRTPDRRRRARRSPTRPPDARGASNTPPWPRHGCAPDRQRADRRLSDDTPPSARSSDDATASRHRAGAERLPSGARGTRKAPTAAASPGRRDRLAFSSTRLPGRKPDDPRTVGGRHHPPYRTTSATPNIIRDRPRAVPRGVTRGTASSPPDPHQEIDASSPQADDLVAGVEAAKGVRVPRERSPGGR